MENIVELYVMKGCSVCPTMERLFQHLQDEGHVGELMVYDLAEHPELAERHGIRSVPFYRINGIGFNGLRDQRELLNLLGSREIDSMAQWITDQLREGRLDEVEQAVLQKVVAREALVQLLESVDTELVVRIGLSAVIEALADQRIFDPYEQRFIELANHAEERIAIDALYYLQLISTPATLARLSQLAESGSGELSDQARELLDEAASGIVIH